MIKEDNAYHTISETSKKINVPSHVLRFWEKKFNIIKPRKGTGGRRYYSPQDIDKLIEIKNLLYQKGFTINGAVKYLKNNNNTEVELTDDKNDILKKIDEALNNLDKIKTIINKN